MIGRLTRLSLSVVLSSAVLSALALLGTASAAHAVQVCGKWDTVEVNGKEYVVQNNVWGADTAQCIDVNATSFTVARAEHTLATNGAPAAYPSIFKGCHWENCTTGSGMPVRVGELGSVTSSWSVTTPSSGAWNVSYDLWFKTSATPGAPDGAELMIWLDSLGGVQPAGSLVASGVPLGGATWNVWRARIGWNYIAYQRTSPIHLSVTWNHRSDTTRPRRRPQVAPPRRDQERTLSTRAPGRSSQDRPLSGRQPDRGTCLPLRRRPARCSTRATSGVNRPALPRHCKAAVTSAPSFTGPVPGCGGGGGRPVEPPRPARRWPR